MCHCEMRQRECVSSSVDRECVKHCEKRERESVCVIARSCCADREDVCNGNLHTFSERS